MFLSFPPPPVLAQTDLRTPAPRPFLPRVGLPCTRPAHPDLTTVLSLQPVEEFLNHGPSNLSTPQSCHGGCPQPLQTPSAPGSLYTPLPGFRVPGEPLTDSYLIIHEGCWVPAIWRVETMEGGPGLSHRYPGLSRTCFLSWGNPASLFWPFTLPSVPCPFQPSIGRILSSYPKRPKCSLSIPPPRSILAPSPLHSPEISLLQKTQIPVSELQDLGL